MSLQSYFERIDTVDRHIRTKASGNMDFLARKLGLSRSGAYKFLQEMIELGFPIAYSKKDNQIYYTKSGRIIGYVFVEDKATDDEDKNEGAKLF